MRKQFIVYLSLMIVCAHLVTSAIAATPPIGTESSNILYVDKKQPTAFKTIQSAIDASSQFKSVIILIAPGLYQEKLYITRNNLSLVGSSLSDTRIEYAQLRNNWRENHDSDWGAAVINIAGSDINIVNLSVTNNYGRLHNTHDHQFAIRGFENATRIILHQCDITADGADTLSLWNKENGLYYHSYCSFTGATDMVCPRGTALIEHSTFFNLKQTATLWHDGELDSEQKLVVANSTFDGVENFWLGRHHYDAQFYLFNNQFSERMADKAIFKKTYDDVSRNRANYYGARYYFYANQSPIKFPWLATNITQAQHTQFTEPSLEQWVFKGNWQPTKVLAELQKELQKETQNHKFTSEPFKL
ncbi:pectinesterase family protein [Pseudoalteromonas prydzensis]|uniref:pectinesterase family protein n=1 Tax=Pseudoalteromonas prydzensis TaxID=182141 RepID=UPI00370423CE